LSLCGAGGALAATAGCLGRLRDAVTSVEYPGPGEPTYRRWLPRPGAVPGVDRSYDASHVRVADLRGDGPVARAGIGLRNLLARTGRDPLGLPDGTVDAVVSIDLARATTLLGTFEPASVARGAATAGYREVGSHRGFTLHERPGRDRGLGIADDAVVFSRNEEPTATVRAVVDAGRGVADRYHEADATFARLSDAGGGATMAWVFPDGGPHIDAEDPAVGSTAAQQFTDDRAYFGSYFLFPDRETASASAVRSMITDEDGRLLPTTPLDVAVDGRLGRAEYSLPVSNIADRTVPTLRPLVAWSFDHDPAAGRLTVIHRAGEPVAADRLRLTTGDGPTDRQFAATYDTVHPGDSVTVAVEPGTRLRVVWEREDTTATFAFYEVPGESG